MQAVFRLVEHHGLRPVDHLVGDLLAAMRGQAVHEDGVGGGFGAALAHAGADVTFIARGTHLAAMRSEGLKVQGGRGETHLVPTQATDDPASVGPVDIVLFCVKLWDVESAGAHIRPMVGPDTAVIPLQNGIDAPDRLIPILGRDAVMGGADLRRWVEALLGAGLLARGARTLLERRGGMIDRKSVV